MPSMERAPKARTIQTLAQAIREAGIVGAGGAGFPTYVKYAKPTPVLVVNGAESEPGYVTDKLLLREHAREYADLFVHLRDVEGYERILVGCEEIAKTYTHELEDLARSTGAFEVAYFPSVYKYGQERALVKVLLNKEVPKKGIPPDVGVTVSNNETLWNIYRAVFEGHPLTTKMISIYGETPKHLGVEAPVGAYATDLLALAGHVTRDARLRLYDGGPVLCDEIVDWTTVPYGVRRTTNGLLLVDTTRAKTRAKAYPRVDGPPLPERLWNVGSFISRVRIAISAKFGAPATPRVEVGTRVRVGEKIAEPPADKLGVPCHASIDGVVTAVTEESIDIAREPSA